VEALALLSGCRCLARTYPHPVPPLPLPGRPGDGPTCSTRPRRMTRIGAWPPVSWVAAGLFLSSRVTYTSAAAKVSTKSGRRNTSHFATTGG